MFSCLIRFFRISGTFLEKYKLNSRTASDKLGLMRKKCGKISKKGKI